MFNRQCTPEIPIEEASHVLLPGHLDRPVIALLQKDGRVSNVEIARELGIAEGHGAQAAGND